MIVRSILFPCLPVLILNKNSIYISVQLEGYLYCARSRGCRLVTGLRGRGHEAIVVPIHRNPNQNIFAAYFWVVLVQTESQ